MSNRSEVFVHLVWATWDRAPILDAETRAWLVPSLAFQARSMGCLWAAAGAAEDHIHLACRLPATLTVAAVAQQCKGWTSRAASARQHPLRWQGGYGAFSFGPSEVAAVEAYLHNQLEHHNRGHIVEAWE
jgi:REP element-mobilizing transposase RayT